MKILIHLIISFTILLSDTLQNLEQNAYDEESIRKVTKYLALYGSNDDVTAKKRSFYFDLLFALENPSNQQYSSIGAAYVEGNIVAKDYDKAIFWFKKSNAREDIKNIAVVLNKQEKWLESANIFASLCDKYKNEVDCHDAGTMYNQAKEYDKAILWLKKSNTEIDLEEIAIILNEQGKWLESANMFASLCDKHKDKQYKSYCHNAGAMYNHADEYEQAMKYAKLSERSDLIEIVNHNINGKSRLTTKSSSGTFYNKYTCRFRCEGWGIKTSANKFEVNTPSVSSEREAQEYVYKEYRDMCKTHMDYSGARVGFPYCNVTY